MNWLTSIFILIIFANFKAGAADLTQLPRLFATESKAMRTYPVRKLPFQGLHTEAYVYNDLDSKIEKSQYEEKMLTVARYFDQSVYPRYYELFDLEPKRDQLQNKIILLFDANLPYTAFHSKVLPKLYQREFILIDLEANLDSNALAYRLPHELQHILRNQYNSNEEDWLNEGLSVFAEYYLNQEFPTEYLKNHKNIGGLPLFFQYELEPSSPHYFNNFLFVYYLYKHYGGLPLIRKLMTSPLSGYQNIEAAFKTLPKQTCIDPKKMKFSAAFQNYQLALTLNRYHQDLTSECNLFNLGLDSENIAYDLRAYSVETQRLANAAHFEMQAARSLYLTMPARCVRIEYQENSGLVPVIIDMHNSGPSGPIQKLKNNKIYCMERTADYGQYLLIINSSPILEQSFSVFPELN